MERLHKVLAAAGVASLRKSEELIIQGKVKVNGRIITKLGTKVDSENDIIEVYDKKIKTDREFLYIMLHKPKGIITTVRDTHNRKTVMDLLPRSFGRIFPVGRLDAQTSGLLLLTNDGQLAHKLTHPKYEFKKTYLARVKGEVNTETIKMLERGLILEDGLTAPAKVIVKKRNRNDTKISITIHEGKNRQVRRMFDKVGHPLISLARTSFGFLTLKGLPYGEYRLLHAKEVKKLKMLYNK